MIPLIISNLSTALEIAKKNNIQDKSPDYIFITPENSIGIEKIREINTIINLKPYQSPKKIVVVQDAQKMTVEAQNSFLKTLEEPPENTIIILIVENPDQLLPTIQSRCKIIIEKNNGINKKNLSNFDNNFINIFEELKTMPLGLRFKKASEIATNRNTAKDWVKNAMIALHQDVIKNSDAITKLQEALAKLEANVTPRLVIENLFIHLKS